MKDAHFMKKSTRTGSSWSVNEQVTMRGEKSDSALKKKYKVWQENASWVVLTSAMISTKGVETLAL